MGRVYRDLLDVAATVHHLCDQVADRSVLIVRGHPRPSISLEDRQLLNRQGLILGHGLHANISERHPGCPFHLPQHRKVLSPGQSNHSAHHSTPEEPRLAPSVSTGLPGHEREELPESDVLHEEIVGVAVGSAVRHVDGAGHRARFAIAIQPRLDGADRTGFAASRAASRLSRPR